MKKLSTWLAPGGTWRLAALLLLLAVTFVWGCSGDNGGDDDTSADDDSSADDDTTNELEIAICDPSNSGFTTEITNAYFPMPVGAQ
jgi:hypothetical protein